MGRIITNKKRSNILNIITCNNTFYINTIKEYVESFKIYSNKTVIYYDIKNIDNIFNIKEGDVLIMYNIVHGLKHNKNLSRFIQFLHDSNLNVIFFIQDEYYDVDFLNDLTRNCKAKIIFTCLTNDIDVKKIYYNVPNCRFVNVLTGYVPDYFKGYFKKINDKTTDIFYRGRNLHYFYGQLGKLKYEIGVKVKEAAKKHNLKEDIEWTDKKRIYSNQWINTLSNSKITLATPSGSNVINKNDNIIKIINKKLRIKNMGHLLPDIISIPHNKVFKHFNIKEELNVGQVSPKMFEAAAVGTVLIMFDNCNYNNIFKPNIHYIPLKIDYSNLDEIMIKIKDNNYLQKIADNAFKDIILSGNYSYKQFVEKVNIQLDNL